jgi:recA bacterial DNA recombination protein
MKELKIISKTHNENIKPVFDIEVENEHHYILENGTISHNSGPIFAASIVVSMNKLKLKEDEDGNKISEVLGIRSKLKVVKSRYAKPFESVELKIPYETGLNPYSGLIDMFENEGMLVKTGNRLKYTALDGTEFISFRKAITTELLDRIMAEYDEWDKIKTSNKLVSSEMEDSIEESIETD